MPTTSAKPLAAVTTVRPPQRVFDAIERNRIERNLHRSAVICGAIDCYLAGRDAAAFPECARALYTELNSKLTMRPVAFSCPPRRLRSYRRAADRFAKGSLSALVSLAVAHVYDV